MVNAVNCVRLLNHRPVPLKQIIDYMLIKKEGAFGAGSVCGFRRRQERDTAPDARLKLQKLERDLGTTPENSFQQQLLSFITGTRKKGPRLRRGTKEKRQGTPNC